jgi:peptide/nickel transport system ATP-binding protein
MSTLLEVKDLRVELMSVRGVVHALGGVDLSIEKGEIHGLVGESGCGKSMTSRAVMRLLPPARSRVSGQVLFDGKDLLKIPPREMAKIRGNRISLIFQDPMTSLNPLMTVGDQIGEAFRLHRECGKAEAREKTLAMLEKVGIYPPEKRIDQYPHELSGGLQQRVMIAMAIANEPDLLIADEPTTALDVTIQAQILELLKSLQKDTGMSILMITHNFGVVAEVCDRVSVMYAGRIVESADARTMFHNAAHPYSKALIDSIPKADENCEYLATIPGSPPELYGEQKGCPFAPRCAFTSDECAGLPQMRSCGDAEGHTAACWHFQCR